jgi:hypothetical protein
MKVCDDHPNAITNDNALPCMVRGIVGELATQIVVLYRCSGVTESGGRASWDWGRRLLPFRYVVSWSKVGAMAIV